jgi:thioesterase domain-containing protein
VHGAGGGVLGYSKLVKYLGNDQPLYGIRAKRNSQNQETEVQIEDMAKTYLKEIQTIQPHGPYFLLGYSFGGFVAYEIACQIRGQGQDVAMLALLDSYFSSRSRTINQLWRPKNLIRFILIVPLWLLGRVKSWFTKEIEPEILDEHREAYYLHLNALFRYHPRVYDGKVILLRVPRTSYFESLEPEMGWEELARGGVETHLIAGSHSNLLEEPYIENWASVFKLCLDRINNETPNVLKRK